MFSVPVTESSQIGEARRLAGRLAAELKFCENDIAKVAIIVTEAATNLIKHTPQGGEIIIESLHKNGQAVINILALDKGPGISSVQLCLHDGYSTTGTQGTGLGAIKRLATTFDIYSQLGSGTVLWAQVTAATAAKALPSIAPCAQLLVEAAAICIPFPGEQCCGDGWSAHFNPDNSTGLYMVVDGLGHGEGAYDAAQAASQIFHLHKNSDLSLADLMQKLHAASTTTRGSALALAKIYFAEHKLEYIGIGNIGSVIIAPEKRQSLISFAGIVGHSMRKLQMFTYDFPPHSLLIMHSDGLISHWDLEKYSHLLGKPAAIIAGLMYQQYKRGRDDVAVIKNF